MNNFYKAPMNLHYASLALILIVSIALASAQTKHIVTQNGTSFSPSTFIAVGGDTVAWRWTSGAHTTTSTTIPAGATSWDSPLTNSVSSFQYVIPSIAGTYSYKCTPHETIGMVGSFDVVITPGISEAASNAFGSLISYPSPCTDNVTISFHSKEVAKNLNLNVSDILGNHILRKTAHPIIGKNFIDIDVSTLQPGLYFYTLSNGEASSTGRFTISL